MSAHIITAGELARRLGGELQDCDPARELREVLPLDEATETSVSFLSNPKYQEKALHTRAGLLIVGQGGAFPGKALLRMANPYWGFAQAVGILHPEPVPDWSDSLIHPTARVHPAARIAPGASIGARTVIGAGCLLHPGVHVSHDCELGEHCELMSGVVLYRKTRLGRGVRVHANTVLGSDGYGYVLVDGRHEKIPQAGWVEVADDVEIGACTTIDRGALGPTRIGKGTKVDNLCQIAHNVQIGEHCLILAQVGISGSTTLGDYVTLAGKVGTSGHLHIGSKSIVSGNSMVAKDLPEGSFVSGYLARPHRQWMECQAAINRLPAILKKLAKQQL